MSDTSLGSVVAQSLQGLMEASKDDQAPEDVLRELQEQSKLMLHTLQLRCACMPAAAARHSLAQPTCIHTPAMARGHTGVASARTPTGWDWADLGG